MNYPAVVAVMVGAVIVAVAAVLTISISILAVSLFLWLRVMCLAFAICLYHESNNQLINEREREGERKRLVEMNELEEVREITLHIFSHFNTNITLSLKFTPD